MPVSKHRRGGKTRARAPQPPAASLPAPTTIEDVRQALDDPALDFAARAVIAGVWWFRELLHRVGDRWDTPTRAEREEAAQLLCVAMDGEQGSNDDLAPQLATMLRPYCGAPSFTEGWEQARHLPAGTVRAAAARILGSDR